MGPEIVALIVVGSALGGTGVVASIVSGVKYMKSKFTSHHSEQDVEVTTRVEERPDGTKVTVTTRKGHLVQSGSHAEHESHQRTGSPAIEAGVGTAFTKLPDMATALVTAGLSGVGSDSGGDDTVLSSITGVVTGALAAGSDEEGEKPDEKTTSELPRIVTAVSLKEAIAQARREAEERMQTQFEQMKALQDARYAEQVARDAEQDAAHQTEVKTLREQMAELESRVTTGSIDDAHSVSADDEAAIAVELSLGNGLTEAKLAAVESDTSADNCVVVSSRRGKLYDALIAWKARVGLDNSAVDDGVALPVENADDSVFGTMSSVEMTPHSNEPNAAKLHQFTQVKQADMMRCDSAASLQALCGSGTLDPNDVEVGLGGDVGSHAVVDVSA